MPENICDSVIAVKSLSLDELAVAADQMISSGKDSAAKNILFAIDHKKSEQSAIRLATVTSFRECTR